MAFGEILKQKRIELGYTKEDVCERTHLMARVVDDLEAEITKRIPSPLYGRGFIRLYCELLKIDPKPLIEDYNKKAGAGSNARVSHPAVHDIPAKPLEPIYTGARRTMPPPKMEEERPVATTHKLVHPAEGTFTSVPKPEVPSTTQDTPPPPPPPMPRAPEVPLFTPPPRAVEVPPRVVEKPQSPSLFDNDSLPLEMPEAPAPTPTAAPVENPAVSHENHVRVTNEPRTGFDTNPAVVPETPAPTSETPPPSFPIGRANLANRRPHKDVTPERELTELRRPTHAPANSIFGSHNPVPNPPNPQLGSIRAAGSSVGSFFQRLFQAATRPRITHMNEETRDPIFNKRAVLRSCMIFGVLVLLTLLVLSFRYVFQISSDAEVEAPLGTNQPGEVFSLRPVAPPPAPYFK